jgi:hypothetical protein
MTDPSTSSGQDYRKIAEELVRTTGTLSARRVTVKAALTAAHAIPVWWEWLQGVCSFVAIWGGRNGALELHAEIGDWVFDTTSPSSGIVDALAKAVVEVFGKQPHVDG